MTRRTAEQFGVLAGAVLAVVLPGCAGTDPAVVHVREPARSGPAVVSLADSIEPLREAFNADVGKPRFIAILSPT